jgi:Icc-related predicted phosphoesterase
LHGSHVEIDQISFFGLGGAVPVTPFGSWSYDFTEEQARQMLQDFPAGAVLVSHSPPKGAVDLSSSGQSLGSEAIREVIERQAPSLVVCGHIHESSGKSQQIGSTPVVNAGPRGIYWQLP